MSGNHKHKPFEGHMHDYEAHIKAVEEDLEYYRAKRFEPRIIYLLRRARVTHPADDAAMTAGGDIAAGTRVGFLYIT